MSFFWPTHPNPNPGVFARLGQLAHCAALAFGALLGWGVAYDGSQMSSESVFGGLVVGLTIATIGRVVRYFLAGE